MILCDFLLSVNFFDKITHVRRLESHKQNVGSCAPWKVASRAQKLVSLAQQFQKTGVCEAGVSHCSHKECVKGD
jgi:hypothetical protein